MSVISINKDNYENTVSKSEKLVLLDFYADWCGPCRVLSPIIEEIANERPEYTVGKVNVDDQPELASEFRVMSVPTLFVLKNGKIVNQYTGANTKAKILDMLSKYDKVSERI